MDAALDLMDGMEACEGYTSASEYNQVRLTSTAWHHQIPCGPGENMPWVFSFLSLLFLLGSYLRRYNVMYPAALQYHKRIRHILSYENAAFACSKSSHVSSWLTSGG